MTTLNPSDKNYLATLSGGDLTTACTGGVGAFQWARSTTFKTTGKYYGEVTLGTTIDGGGICICGDSSSVAIAGGFPTPGQSDSLGATYRGNDGVAFHNSTVSFPPSWNVAGQVGQFCIDCDNDLVWFGRNNTFSGNPAAGTGGISQSLTDFYVMVGGRNADTMTVNFGATAFAYTPPSGFGAWDAAPAGLTGTTTIAFTPTGTVTGRGALTASTAVAFTPTGVVRGKGAITGSTAVAFTPTGVLTGRGTVTGTATASFNASGSVQGRGALTGTSSVAFSLTGTLAFGLVGTANITTTVSGTLTGRGSLLGNATIAFGLTGSFPQALWTPIMPQTTLWTAQSQAATNWTQQAPDASIWTVVS